MPNLSQPSAYPPLQAIKTLKPGDRVGEWDSALGKAEITVKKSLGNHATPLAAQKAIVASGEAGVVALSNSGVAAYTIDDGARLDDLDIGDQTRVAKGLTVFSFVNDAGESIADGLEILPPTGTDNGKNVRIFNSYSKVSDYLVFKSSKALSTRDDVARLRELGYTVTIDHTATKSEFLNALYDSRTAGVLWFGHGSKGGFSDHAGQRINAKDINPAWVSPNLKLTVFESCQVGQARSDWEQALPGAALQAWDKNVKNYESSWFNIKNGAGGLADLIETSLGGDFAQEPYLAPSHTSGSYGLTLGGFGAAAAAAAVRKP